MLTSVFSAQAQEHNSQPDNYFRYYTLQVKNLSAEESESLARRFDKNQAIEVDMYCQQNNSILIKVNADYLKRIDETKAEIKNISAEIIPQRRIGSVDLISVQDKSTICK